MNILTKCIIMPMIFLALSPLHAHGNELKKWFRYKDPMSLKGLQTKPIEIKYGHKTIHVNGKRMSRPSAIRILRMSLNLSPSPDIVIYIKGRTLESSKPFLNSISNSGLCDNRKCWTKVDSY